MRRILDRERMRSDRGNSIFTLLTLAYPTACDAAELGVLAQIFRDRLRITDDAGLLDARRIGVVLPETSPEGAWSLAADLCRLLPAGARRPQCEVYTYPSADEPDEPASDPSDRQAAATNGKAHGARVRAGGIGSSGVRVKSMQPLFLQPLPLWKRAIDILGSGTALLLASPLLALTALAIKLTSPGPIFYAQQRDGHGGRRFWIYKFRTMVVNADALKAQLLAQSEQDGPAFKLKNDPRVTRLGRLLRRSCVDELPQLFNVLKGDMSLVGPRPMCSKEAQHCRRWERRRLDVTPGLTCTWQVFGGTRVTFVEWMRMDLRYARARSLWSDFRLMALTVPSVIKRDGVY